MSGTTVWGWRHPTSAHGHHGPGVKGTPSPAESQSCETQ